MWGGVGAEEEGRPYLCETCDHVCCSRKIMKKKKDLLKARSANRNPTVYVDTCSIRMSTQYYLKRNIKHASLYWGLLSSSRRSGACALGCAISAAQS